MAAIDAALRASRSAAATGGAPAEGGIAGGMHAGEGAAVDGGGAGGNGGGGGVGNGYFSTSGSDALDSDRGGLRAVLEAALAECVANVQWHVVCADGSDVKRPLATVLPTAAGGAGGGGGVVDPPPSAAQPAPEAAGRDGGTLPAHSEDGDNEVGSAGVGRKRRRESDAASDSDDIPLAQLSTPPSRHRRRRVDAPAGELEAIAGDSDGGAAEERSLLTGVDASGGAGSTQPMAASPPSEPLHPPSRTAASAAQNPAGPPDGLPLAPEGEHTR